MFDPTRTRQPPLTEMYLEDFGDSNPPIVGFVGGSKVILFIKDPNLLEEVFIKNNKYLSKDLFTKELLYPLMGESVLLSESSEFWSNKRKVLATSFYKDKLIKMITLVHGVINKTIEEWNSKFIEKNLAFDLIEEISLVFIRIMLVCALGVDITNVNLTYFENGEEC